MEFLINLLLFFGTLAIAYAIGGMIETAHYKSIQKDEQELLPLAVVTSKKIHDPQEVEGAELVCGSVVISLDYLKRFLAGLRQFFGGRISSYETLLDRGRREAIIRMKKKALSRGYNMVVNMRFETSSVGQVTSAKGSVGCFEVLAFGTAIKSGKKGIV